MYPNPWPSPLHKLHYITNDFMKNNHPVHRQSRSFCALQELYTPKHIYRLIPCHEFGNFICSYINFESFNIQLEWKLLWKLKILLIFMVLCPSSHFYDTSFDENFCIIFRHSNFSFIKLPIKINYNVKCHCKLFFFCLCILCSWSFLI